MEDITVIQNVAETAQELINWCIAVLAGGGISLTAAISFAFKFFGKNAQLKMKQFQLSQKNEELRQAKAERDEYKKKIDEILEKLAEYENCTRRAVTAFGTGVTFFINGSRASEECKEAANGQFREGIAALPEISTEKAEEIFDRSAEFSKQTKTRRAQAVANASDAIGKLKSLQ